VTRVADEETLNAPLLAAVVSVAPAVTLALVLAELVPCTLAELVLLASLVVDEPLVAVLDVVADVVPVVVVEVTSVSSAKVG
jgi:hypothetical protein